MAILEHCDASQGGTSHKADDKERPWPLLDLTTTGEPKLYHEAIAY